jgi:phosphatidylglycerol:prolipoprotein diacylglycerol transferase
MWQTLFIIPDKLFQVPVFGLGILLAVWLAAAGSWLVWRTRKFGWDDETNSSLITIAIVAGVIWLGLPNAVESSAGGIPIRGFGVMMLAGLLSGIGVTMYRARRMGVDPEIFVTLAVWGFIAGIAGARGFYIIEYWSQFRRDTWQATLQAAVNVPEGGIVLYGGVITAALATIFLFTTRKLPYLPMMDLAAPGLALGIAFGRIGCLMNGCCYGGLCEQHPWLAVSFPQTSPVYTRHAETGWLLGLEFEQPGESHEEGIRIEKVQPNTVASEAGLKAGERITQVDYEKFESPRQLLGKLLSKKDGETLVMETSDQRAIRIPVSQIPKYSLPVHPTQLYDSINALLIFFTLWLYYPMRQGDGEVSALFLAMYPIGRFVIEIIRVDEPGQWGTSLSISQWISFGLLAIAVLLWARSQFLNRRPLLPLSAP